MPYENEHSCRLESPDKYKKFARKNCAQKSDGKCIDVIYGIITANKSEIQALRYNKKIWTESSARSHCKSRKGSFEAAKKEVEMPEIIYKRLKCETEFTKGKKGDEYFLATISTGDVDRDGDILEPKGLDLTDFNKTVLYRHNRTMGASAEETLPVGRSLWEQIRGNKVKAAIEFNKKTQLSQLLYEFYKEKLMDDWSVGFSPVDGFVEPITDEKTGQVTGRHIKKWKLHEISAVPVGANQFTTTQVVRAKEIQKELGISDEAYLELFENMKEEESTGEEIDENIDQEVDSTIDEKIDVEYDIGIVKSDITEIKNEILILSKKVNDLIEIITKLNEQKTASIEYPTDELEFVGFGDSDNTSQEPEQTDESEDEIVLELFDSEEEKETKKEE